MWTALFMSVSSDHKAERVKNSMQEENQKQSFSSRLPECLNRAHSHETEHSYPFAEITLKGQYPFNQQIHTQTLQF